MPRPNRFRRHRRKVLLALGLAVFLAGDLGGAALLGLDPADNDELVLRRPSPLYHHELAPRVAVERAAWGGYFYPVRTNSLGFKDRAAREVPLAAPPGRRRLLVIGDSFTEGIGVPYEDTFVGALEERLAPRGVDVLGAGVASYAPSIYYRRVRHLVETVGLEVHHLVVCVDISDVEDEARGYALDAEDRVTGGGGLFQGGREDPAATTWGALTRWAVRHSLLARSYVALKVRLTAERDARAALAGHLALERARWTLDPEVRRAWGDEGLRRCQERLDRLQREVLAPRGVGLTVVVYPWPTQIAAGDRDSLQARTWRAWAAAHGAGFVDLFPRFIDGRPPEAVIAAEFIPGDVHWNAAGHARVAGAVLEDLEAAGVVPPP